MDISTAVREAYRLQSVWVGAGTAENPYDLGRVHRSMLQEHRWNRERPARCTPACARETKGALILLGKVRKALAV